MKYMGSKARLSKELAPIINDLIKDNNITKYAEPFVGGANMIEHIDCEKRVGGDNSEQLIELLKYVRDGGELPNEVPKTLYDDVRANKNTDKYSKWYVGAIGFLASYNGRYFDGGYAKEITTKTGVVRNYYDEAKRNLLKQAEKLKNIGFIYGDYSKFSKVKDVLIYCDIPYEGVKQFATSKNFHHEDFWNWTRSMSEYNIVLVSEYNAPKDFVCIFEKTLTTTMNNRDRKKDTEKLFIHKDSYNKYILNKKIS